MSDGRVGTADCGCCDQRIEPRRIGKMKMNVLFMVTLSGSGARGEMRRIAEVRGQIAEVKTSWILCNLTSYFCNLTSHFRPVLVRYSIIFALNGIA
jgi:hypothetical protein